MKGHSDTSVEIGMTEHEAGHLILSLYENTISRIDSEIENVECMRGPERADAVFRLLGLKVKIIGTIVMSVGEQINNV